MIRFSTLSATVTNLGLRICILTLYRIKVTSDITQQNQQAWQVLSARISLLTCLEALLGVINACLPTIKPIFRRVRSGSTLGSLSAWPSSRTSNSRRTHTSGSSSAPPWRWLNISHPRPVMRRPSHLMFTYESTNNSHKSPSLTHQSISEFRLPTVRLSRISLDIEKNCAVSTRSEPTLDS